MLPTLKTDEYPEAVPVIPKFENLPAEKTGKEESSKSFVATLKEFY